MLREQSAGSVLTLTKKLAEANAVVSPIPGTPLEVLNNACYSPTMDGANLNDADEGAMMYRVVEASRAPALNGRVRHDDDMEDIVNVVARTVQANLQLAKNVVNPTIKEVIACVEKEIQEADASCINLINVIPDNYRAIWDSPTLEGMVNRYSETAVEDIAVNRSMPALEGQAVTDLLVTGAGRFDQEVGEWIKDFPEGFIADVYNDFFAKTTRSDKSKFNDYFGLTADRERILAIHLMSRRLEKNIPEGVEMDLSQYRSYIISVMAQSGRALCRILEKRTKDIKQKTLVRTWPLVGHDQLGGVDSNILVNADIYTQWLEEGGCPEILFGAYLLDRNTDYKALIEGAEKYKQAWNRQANLLRTRAASQRYNVAVSAIRKAVTKKINQIEESELPANSRAVLHERLVEKADKITTRDLEDLWGTVRGIVCYVMYAHTNAEEILCAIDAVGRANPEMDVREAALLATIDVVVAWVAKLMQVKVVPLNV